MLKKSFTVSSQSSFFLTGARLPPEKRGGGNAGNLRLTYRLFSLTL
jgi:hypothetical protein